MPFTLNNQEMQYVVAGLLGVDYDPDHGIVEAATDSGASADGPTPISGYKRVTDLLLDGARWLCRSCCPVTGTATGAVSAGAVPAVLRTSALTVTQVEGAAAPAGCRMWAVSGVSVDGVPLRRLGRPQFDTLYTGYGAATGPQAALTDWARYGSHDAVRVAPPLSVGSKTVTAEGMILPAPMGLSGADTLGFTYCLDDDAVREGVCPFAAYVIALQATDDVQLSARKGEMVRKVNDFVTRQWARVDPYVRQWLYGGAPVLLQAGELPDMGRAAR